MSHLSSQAPQLNKSDAQKALAAMSQRQHANAAQFDHEAAFSTILSARTSRSETVADNKSKQEHNSGSQDEAPPKRVQLGQPKKLPPIAPHNPPHDLPHKPAALTATRANRQDHASRKAAADDRPADNRTAQADEDFAAADSDTTLGTTPDTAAITADSAGKTDQAAPTPVAAVPDAASAAAPDAVPVAVALPAAEPQSLPLHMLLALSGTAGSGNPTTPGTADSAEAAPAAATASATPGLLAGAGQQAQQTQLAQQKSAGRIPAAVRPADGKTPAAATLAGQPSLTIPDDLLATAKPDAGIDSGRLGAATTALQQLLPAAHAAAQSQLQDQIQDQAVTPRVALQSVRIAAAQAQPLDGATPAAALQAPIPDAVPATANPLLAAGDSENAVSASQSPAQPVNPALVTVTPALQTAQAAATGFAPALTAEMKTAQTKTAAAQAAESKSAIDGAGLDLGMQPLARYDNGGAARGMNGLGRLPAAAGAALPANIQVAVQLARAAKNGDKSFNIQLHPAELGRVEVKLEVNSRGGATARILVDSQATLDLLQTHRQGLERALTDAGLKCDTGGISFDLRDSQTANQGAGQNAGQGANHSAQEQAHSRGGKNNAGGAVAGTADASADPSIIANLTLSLQPGRIDIKA